MITAKARPNLPTTHFSPSTGRNWWHSAVDGLVAVFVWYVNSSGKGLQAQCGGDLLHPGHGVGPAIYIVVYTLRPVTFFSAVLFTVAGGFLFGPLWGVVYTVIGANPSAIVAYLIGRYFGGDTLEADGPTVSSRPMPTHARQ